MQTRMRDHVTLAAGKVVVEANEATVVTWQQGQSHAAWRTHSEAYSLS